MTNIFVFTQNLKLDSLTDYKKITTYKEDNIFVTTHFLFDNERKLISDAFSSASFFNFADFLSDEEMGKCDNDAYTSENMDYEVYLSNLKKLKNEIVVKKVVNKFPDARKYILSDDLGLDFSVWKKKGFRRLEGDYYYREETSIIGNIKHFLSKYVILKSIYHKMKNNKVRRYSASEVCVGYYHGRKYVFLGNMNRIEYRLNIPFETSEEECERLNAGEYETKDTCTYMTTWHEHGKCSVPDDEKYEVYWAQDGYLPPNYTHKDYCFKPKNVVYYCWDELGTYLFKNQKLPYELIPFRKKLFLPEPVFPLEVKNILVVASGSGDWTALKNRSDDDIMVDAFVQMARRFPGIHFTYRCHPTWVHPLNVGVNAINRVKDYFDYLNLPNLTLSSNIPVSSEKGFQLSYSRSSFEEDLKKADFVFGEHSISMIDAAFKGLPFSSVNITKRRNFFVGINDLGFPTCSSHDDIASMIEKATDSRFQMKYLQAVKNYNEMTEK